jgi:phage baseplate assembly protein W
MSIYSDVNSISPTTQQLLVDVEDVYQSLFNLFNTRPGERLFEPEFGLQLEEELFEIIDDITSVDVFRIVNEAISQWETRVIVDSSRTVVTPMPEDNKYDIVLYFSIQGISGQTFTYQGSITQ